MFLKRRSFFEKCDKILYLPIEIHSREFHAKLYLAYQACQRGWTVLIGPEYDVNKLARYLPSGVYFGNGFHKKATRISRIMKKYGHSVILQDEEGLVRWTTKLYQEYRINPEINNFADHFLCWGDEDKSIIQSSFKKITSAISVGNLRLDLLSPSLRKIFLENMNDIKSDNGDFVLINGNFGSTNHTLGVDYYLNEIRLRGWLDNSLKKKFQLERVAFQKKIFEEMVELSIAISKSGQKVIVRPHPSESIEVWEKKTANYSKNIKIIRSGNIIPWLVSAKLIIHNGCNTAIEGLLLDKTIISYRPYKNSNVETYLPNAISVGLETKEDVINYIKNFKVDKFNIAKKESLSILSKHVKINKVQEDASSRILDLIENLPLKKKINIIRLIKDNINIEVALLKSSIVRMLYKKNFSYLKKKCPKLDINQIKNVLDFFSVNTSDHYKVEALNLTTHSVIISSKINQ
jgi:surface carbohydrate biosynthesis protein